MSPTLNIQSHLDRLNKLVTDNENSLDSLWGRIVATWCEKKSDGELQTHIYAPCINTSTGDLYFDCDLAKIFRKCIVQLIIRPFHALIKTIYHAAFLPSITLEIIDVCKGHQNGLGAVINIAKSIADIIRTPLYTLAMMVASIAVIIMSTFDPQLLYSGRALIGALEATSNWGWIHTRWTLAPCFQPTPLTLLADYGNKPDYPDTIYPSQNPIDRELTHLARKHIRYLREHTDCFSSKQPRPNTPYISPIYQECRRPESI